MNKGKITITVGVSGSGKSAWAHEEWQKDPLNTVISNRDKIRELLFGYTESNISEYYKGVINNLERQVTKYEDVIIHEALNEGKHVIVDATNLKGDYIKRFNFWNVPTTIEWFDVTLKEALTRNMGRVRQVGEDVIVKQYAQYITLRNKGVEDFVVVDKLVIQDTSLPKAIICDIDGCLAKSTGRNMFDWSRVKEDEIQEHIRRIVNFYFNSGHKVFIFTGRDAVCFKDTFEWLQENGVEFHSLHSRPLSDYRKDSIIKRELFDNHVKDKYNVELVIDDRMQVLEEWVAMGLPVLSNNPLALKF